MQSELVEQLREQVRAQTEQVYAEMEDTVLAAMTAGVPREKIIVKPPDMTREGSKLVIHGRVGFFYDTDESDRQRQAR